MIHRKQIRITPMTLFEAAEIHSAKTIDGLDTFRLVIYEVDPEEENSRLVFEIYECAEINLLLSIAYSEYGFKKSEVSIIHD